MATSDEEGGFQTEYLQEVAYLDATLDLDPETSCTICNAEFLDAEDLKIHMNQVHTSVKKSTQTSAVRKSNKTYTQYTTDDEIEEHLQKCQFCDYYCSSLDVYATHIAKKHLRSLFCCEICTKCFTEEIKMRKHEKKHKYDSAFACSQCSFLFSTEKEVAAHEFEFHNNSDDGIILLCLPYLSSFLKLNALKYLQSTERVLQCHICTVTKSNSIAEVKAYINHLNKCDSPVYVCDICCYISNTKKTLIKHMQRKNKCKYPQDIISTMTTCTKCRNKVLCVEMRSHLNKCTIYNCSTCNMQFNTISKLSAHQSDAHPIELDVIKCRFCAKEYVGNESLNKHIKRSHGPQFPLYKYACKSCNSIFKHPQELFAHYFTKHKDLQPYTCKICDKTFRVRKRFTIHIKMEHKGVGVVEFDENYLVFFASQKSENPFIPKCVIPEMVAMMNEDKNKKNKVLNDDMTTEAETEAEAKIEKTIPKQKRRRRKREVEALSSSEEEETENLLTLKKRAERKLFQKRYKLSMASMDSKRRQITCKVCNKYCYTVQNYEKHIKIHSKNKSFECIKCTKSFKTKKDLTNHVSKDHATSKLIETLKDVLKRKHAENNPSNDSTVEDNYENFENLTMSERFMKTIKKIKMDKLGPMAKITQTTGTISVKNFLESFVPDPSEGPKDSNVTEVEQPVVTIKRYNSPFYRKRSIHLTRFTQSPPPTEIKLRMPEKFKTDPLYDNEKVKLKIGLVQRPYRQSSLFTYETSYTNNDHNYDTVEDTQDHEDYDDKDDAIPDVAHEVMLEGSEELPKRNIIIPEKPDLQAPQKIVIPKLPAGYKKIHIATLQPQAPFYKIITVKNEENSDEAIVIDPQTVPEKKKRAEPPKIKTNDVIHLPDGTKFISANPLEHLLGGRPLESLLEPIKSKYYNPRCRNIKGLLTDALQNLENANHRVRKRNSDQISEASPQQSTPAQRNRGPPRPKIAKVKQQKLTPAKEKAGNSTPIPTMLQKSTPKKNIEEKSTPENSAFDKLLTEDTKEISESVETIPEKNEPGISLPEL